MSLELRAAASFALAIAVLMPTTGYGQSGIAGPTLEARNRQETGLGPRLDQMQWIGTHNSYHIEPTPSEAFPDLAYTHSPLPDQLAMGIRFFELDIHRPLKRPGSATSGELEVFHVVGTDEGTHCRALRLCLQQIGSFVRENPDVGPVFVQLELKVKKGMRGQQIAGFLLAVNAEITRTIGADHLLVPSDIADRATNLRASVQRGGWPQTSATRNKVIFILNTSDRVTQIYLRMLKADFTKVMFPALNDANDPSAAVANIFDPSNAAVCQASQSGQLVITYADWRTTAARENNTRGRDAAFRSGAQLIATDFPVPDQRKSSYKVAFVENHSPQTRRYVRLMPSCTSE